MLCGKAPAAIYYSKMNCNVLRNNILIVRVLGIVLVGIVVIASKMQFLTA